MPIPKTKDVGKTMRFLKREKPGMARKQKIAIALETARRAGAKIKRKKKKKKSSGKSYRKGTVSLARRIKHG